MKKIILALALLGAPLSACTANQVLESAPVIGNVCKASDRVLIDEKVVFAAETLFNIPADVYKRAVTDGHLPVGELRSNIRGKLLMLDHLRKTISHARGAVNCDFADMKALHADIMTLLPRKAN